MSKKDSSLSITSVSKTYKNGTIKALDNFSIELTSGIYGILGPNGAGKSTLMNIITQNINMDCGEILFNGENIHSLKKQYRDVIGYMPQHQSLYDDFTASRFLWYMAALKGINKKVAKVKIDNLLETVNLSDVSNKKIGSFSGGMKQRVLIAQALLNDPKILILDEPTAGLDPKERIRIRNFVSELSENKIVLISTHVVSDIEFISKEILLLKKGKLLSADSNYNLCKSIDDKVFEINIKSDNELKEIQKKFKISNLYYSGEKTIARIVSDIKPTEYSYEKTSPTLEDLYLYNFE